jgi:hypothetical protein
MFLARNPNEEFIRSKIRKKIGGESWDRLDKYLLILTEKGLIEMINKTDTMGHVFFKINSKGIEVVQKFNDWKKPLDSSNDEALSTYP